MAVTDPGVGGGDREVAREQQLAATGERVTARTDDRDGHARGRLERVEHLADALEVAPHPVRVVLQRADVVQVRARGEGAAGPAHDEDRGVAGGTHGGGEPVEHRGPEGVARGRAVQGRAHHGPAPSVAGRLDVDDDVAHPPGHGRLTVIPAASRSHSSPSCSRARRASLYFSTFSLGVFGNSSSTAR